MRWIVPVIAAALFAGCAASQPRRVAAAPPEQRSMLLDRIKSLEGTWEVRDEQGQTRVASVFAVSSNGSVVREVMLPGAPEEMTNVYHMDGPALVMTHYCAMGNQPRLRAAGADAPGVITLRLDSVSNYTSAAGGYMGELEITIRDKDHVTERWTHFKDGKPAGTASFDLVRKG
jgi:hypothetical protein